MVTVVVTVMVTVLVIVVVTVVVTVVGRDILLSWSPLPTSPAVLISGNVGGRGVSPARRVPASSARLETPLTIHSPTVAGSEECSQYNSVV